MKKILLILCTMTVLSGCAAGVVKTSRSDSVREVEIRSVTTHGFEYSNLIGMSLFGVLGVNLDNKVVKESSETIGSILTTAITQERLMKNFQETASRTIVSLYPNGKLSMDNSSTTVKYKTFNEWFARETGTIDSSASPSKIIVEVGYRFEAVRKIQGLDADGWLGIKIIEANTGKVIGKAIDNSIATMSGIRILKPGQEANQSEFLRESDRAFTELMTRLTNGVMSKVSP